MVSSRTGDSDVIRERHQRLATSLPLLAGWVFMGFGAAMAIGGAFITVDDPAGLALLAFGLLFIGAGYLAKRLFAVPEGKMAVVVGTQSFATSGPAMLRRRHSQSAIIHVDAGADDAEIAAAERDWLHRQWQARPDWVVGRIVAEDERSGYWQILAAWMWSGFAALSIVAALIWGGMADLVAVGAVTMASVMVVLAVRVRWRQRKFGASHLLMDASPARLGRRLSGMIETGVAATGAPRDGFVINLACVHRWEQADTDPADGNRRSRRRRQVLWEQERRAAGQVGDDGRHLSVSVQFDIPEDCPGSSLVGSSEGVVWELRVTAALPGLDYHARFQVPVLSPELAHLLEFETGAAA